MAVANTNEKSSRILLRWRDFDAFGHVYHATFIELLDEARAAWVTSFVSPAAGENHVVARLEVSYDSEVARPVTWLEVTTQISRIGRTSLQLREVMRDPEGVKVVTCDATIVMWDGTTRSPRPLTYEEITRARKFEVKS